MGGCIRGSSPVPDSLACLVDVYVGRQCSLGEQARSSCDLPHRDGCIGANGRIGDESLRFRREHLCDWGVNHCADGYRPSALGAWERGDRNERVKTVLQYSIPNLAAVALLIVGSFFDDGARKLMWTLFLLAVAVGVFRARQGDWIVRAGHFAERHGLIVIIALGEIVVAIGIAVVSSLDEAEGLPNDTLIALAAAGVMAGLLWWGYFDRVLPALEHRAETLTGRDRARFVADVYTVLHILIVGGIIAIAAAAEEMLLHPKDAAHTEFLIMFVLGIALFFGGIAASAFRAYRAIAKERIVGLVAVAAVVLFGRTWNGVTLLIAVDVVLLLTLLAEQRRIEQPAVAT